MDEYKLRGEIANIWGEYGAHVEVFDMMSKRIAALEARIAELEEEKAAALAIGREEGRKERTVEIFNKTRNGIVVWAGDIEKLYPECFGEGEEKCLSE